MYDAKTDAMATLGILHYVTTTEGKEKARTVIDEWIRRIQLRDIQLREMLLQYVDSIDTSVFDEQTVCKDEQARSASSTGIDFLLKFADSINTPLLDPELAVETDMPMDEDVTTTSST